MSRRRAEDPARGRRPSEAGERALFGALHTLIILITMWDWAFYVFFGIIDVVLTGLVVWYAWHWPRQEAT